ncbi:MAG: hypothetical protein IKP88_18660 [Lachnospiraceae bacterium]|nr:hypothetical protein [Lachnospiraceae bacterium]
MSIPYWKREQAIKKLFDYEESHNIPKNERFTMDPYADNPAIKEPSPRKKGYVDIRDVIGIVEMLKL